MTRRFEVAVPAAAAVMVLTAALGGGFFPLQKMLVGAGMIVVWIIASVEWRGRLEAPELALAGLMVWAAISAVWVGAAPLASKETVVAWVVAWTLWIISRRGGVVARAMGSRILVLGAVAIAGAIIVAAFSTMTVRTGGPFENPNVAAAFLVPILPMGMIAIGAKSRLGWGWLFVVSAALVLTGSRAGLLAAVAAAAFLLPRGRIRLFGVLTGAGLALGALTWRFVTQPDLLAWHRISIWRAVLEIWATHPLTGVGPGCLVEAAGAERILHPDQVGRYQFVVGVAESTPLAILVQLGMVGFVLAGLAAGWWWVCARESGALDLPALRAGLASVVTLSLFHDVLTIEPVLWWWAVVLGILEAMGRKVSVSAAQAPAAAPRLAGAVVVIWLTTWGILSPAWVRWIFAAGPVTPVMVERTLRAEPWYPEPAATYARELLERKDQWSWETAAEGLHWARFAVGIQPGLARRWADLGRVHTRILSDLGGTDHDVEAARWEFERACELDPHLPWHWLERARLERILGSHQNALVFVRRALVEEPNTVRGWLMLGRLELEQGRMAEARGALEEAMVRAELGVRPGLTAYERELLLAPNGQIDSLERALNGSPMGRP